MSGSTRAATRSRLVRWGVAGGLPAAGIALGLAGRDGRVAAGAAVLLAVLVAVLQQTLP